MTQVDDFISHKTRTLKLIGLIFGVIILIFGCFLFEFNPNTWILGVFLICLGIFIIFLIFAVYLPEFFERLERKRNRKM